MKNTFRSKKNLVWFPGKYFPFILDGKHFPEIMKNLEMSYYLLIISNLVLKLLSIKFDPHSFDCYLFYLK